MDHREMPQPVSVKGKILLADGSETEFSINPDTGWQQWGNDHTLLGETVDLLDDLARACAEHFPSEAGE